MSAQLGKKASQQASPLHNISRQLFQRVPPIPAGISLVGKTALVTGANVGLGLECARHFLQLGPPKLLIMAVRSLEKGEKAASGLRAEFPAANIQVWQLDLACFRSVQAFSSRCNSEIDDRLHVAVLNAGLAKMRFERAADEGHGTPREFTTQVNYLSTALLALLLLPKLKPSTASPEPGRLSIVTSDAALGCKLEDPGATTKILDSIDQPKGYDGYQQYCRSKLLATMFAARLAELTDPTEVIINCSNPGATKGTGFLDGVDSWLVNTVMSMLYSILGRTAADASRIYVHSALVLGRESHGSFTDWRINAWPVVMYTEVGRQLGERVWNETIEELAFAGVDEVIKGLEH
ncbi:hypothetical protein B0H63DRAFT_192404 [Podospora didyma]|uniref:Dehydrogenase/reductase n=1 Tax=Podospora didyma TaxID=330526 RepID=A0AAE0NR06_9PEZI|nr:hypothetical protein B0H63DRAFT_192404 [Podospora didyma]